VGLEIEKRLEVGDSLVLSGLRSVGWGPGSIKLAQGGAVVNTTMAIWAQYSASDLETIGATASL
jgi:hypothetical protein